MKFTKVAYTAQLKATKTIQNKFMICTFHASLLTTEMRYDSYLFSSFLFVGDNLIVLSLVLIACLCEYLATRYPQVSWIKLRNKLTFFTIFVVYLIAFKSFLCSTPLY